MKWTSLRRWTMRTIHATILGSALLGSAGVVYAQAPSTAASKLPGIHYTKSQSFDLPVDMDAGYRANLLKVRLFVKTPTTGWQQLDEGSGELKKFNIRVPHDGEFWYSLQTVSRQGQMTPPDVSMEPPAQRVIVDTTAPMIHVQSANTPDGELCLRVTVQDANPDHATLRAVCRTATGDIPLEPVPNQPGMFSVKNAELMRYPVVITAMDMSKNVATKEVNVRDIIGSTLAPAIKGPTDVVQVGVRPEVPKDVGVLPPPRFSENPPNLPPANEKPAVKTEGNETPGAQKLSFPPPPPPIGSTSNKIATPPEGSNVQASLDVPAKTPVTTNLGGVPHQLINTTHATVEYRIDQVGPSGVGKVEIYMTPDKGQTWHRLSEDMAKRSPASINLPGDGVYGIRIVVSNGNGFGGKAPARGDAPHCSIEVDSTPPFVQLRSTDVQALAGHVELRWNATDNNLGKEPVSLFYRTKADGPWQVIARNVKNDGLHRWAFPRDAGGQFFFKVEVADLAGNISHDVSRQPIVIDMTEPRATVVGVTGSGSGRP